MKDPRRLLEGDASELELRLLTLAQHEEAPSAAPRRLAAQLGLPTGLVGLETLGSGAEPLGSTSAIPPVPLAVGAAGSGLLQGVAGKLLLVGVLGALGGGLLFGVMPSARPPEAAPQRAASNHAVSAPASPSASVPAPSDPGAVEAARPAPAVPDPSPLPVAAPKLKGVLDREVAELARVRAALQTGQARAALAELSAFEREHPASVLTQEARALRIEALLSAQEREAARREGERFLRGYPDSPHRARVQALLRADRSLR